MGILNVAFHTKRRGALRKRVFTSLGELNDAIRELLTDLNNRVFQKLPGSRSSTFETLDRPALRPVPANRYEYVEFRRARVGMDKMIDVGGRMFSAPFQLVRQEVDVRVTAAMVEILHGGRRVASHERTPGNDPVIDPSHLTPADKAFGHWTPEREVEWSLGVGPSAHAFVTQRLNDIRDKTQGYRLGLGLRKLAAEYGVTRLETACLRALAIGATKLASLRSILLNRLDITGDALTEANFEHPNLRGPDYYP